MTSEQEVNDYSISNEQVKGFFNNFFIQLWALLVKRWHQTRRSIGVLCIEILVPIMLVVAGFAFTLVKFEFDSDPRHFEVQNFKDTQRIFYNSDNLHSSAVGATTKAVIDYLVNQTEYSPTGIAVTATANTKEAISELDEYIFSQREVSPMKPFRYGSYYLNQIDQPNHKYQFATYANITSTESAAEFNHYMYEAIMRYDASNPNFSYKFVLEPFP